ncbi:MAG: metalloregulator ArsR/SmtB family transcription factor [Pseudomonadota bacterium]
MAYGDAQVQLAFDALADPTRRRVLEAVSSGRSTPGEISAGLPVSRPAVSQHLKQLLAAGLVEVQAQGTRRHYRLVDSGPVALRRYLDELWGDALQRFASYVESQAPGGGRDDH